MHYLPDTNDEESLQERYWPDSFKQVVSEVVRKSLDDQFKDSDFAHVFLLHYAKAYADIKAFRMNLANAVVIGAEKGADDGFEMVYAAFIKETALPQAYYRAGRIWPFRISQKDRKKIHKAIFSDYFIDDGFNYAYRDGYKKHFSLFSDFIHAVAELLVLCIINGVNSTLERHYAAFFHGLPLPIMRRNPKRLKTW